MRRTTLFAVLALFSLGSFAQSDAAQDRAMRLVAAQYQKGHDELAKVQSINSNTGRLHTLDRAIFFLRSARKGVSKNAPDAISDIRRNVDLDLANALNDQSEIYYTRKSLPLAEKRATEALAVIPGNARAAMMLRRIETAKERDIYDDLGTVAVRRIRDRRAAAGLPLRDRGLSNRR